MSMSKKDFIALADQLRIGVEVLPRDVVDVLCQFMHTQNPAFMESRWREYLAGNCGPSGGAIKKQKCQMDSKSMFPVKCTCPTSEGR